jgi:galactose mutarotase-like enzyme
MATTAQVEHLGVPGIRLAADELEAVVIPSAGMVVASLRLRGEELLGRADLLGGWIDGGHTMGIPLLHPWANRIEGTSYDVAGTRVEIDPSSPLLHRDSTGLPIHGLLGATPAWKDVEHGANEARASLGATLDAADVDGLLDAFPFPHRLELRLELRPGVLSIALELVPTGAVAVPVAFGWHPYFQLPSEPRDDWRLKLPQMQALELDARMLPTGLEHPVEALESRLTGLTFDDGFGGIEPRAELSLGADERLVTVVFDEGYPYGQVFAPPNQDVVALEPMTAPANALVSGRGLVLAQPGTSHRARFSVHVR